MRHVCEGVVDVSRGVEAITWSEMATIRKWLRSFKDPHEAISPP